MFPFTVDSILGTEINEKNTPAVTRTHNAFQPRNHHNKVNKCPKSVAVSKYGTAIVDSEYFGRVSVTLDNYLLWNMFKKVGTEMVITKTGR